jgi:RES domain-containing protein
VTLWRLSNQTDLAGRGGMRAPGRWHSVGHPVVYLAEHPACCLLEALAHDLRLAELPRQGKWLEIAVDPAVAIDVVDGLPAGWTEDLSVTRRIGDAWLRSRSAALLRVPSAHSPSTSIHLLNPRHPDASRVVVSRVHPHAPVNALTPAETATPPAETRRGRPGRQAPAPKA